MTSPALCEICTDTGRANPLAAIGICARCGKSFCGGHAVTDQWGVPFLDLCKPCREAETAGKQAQKQAKAVQGKAEIARIRELIQELDQAGVQPTERHDYERRWKKRRFGKGYIPNRYVDVRVSIAPAWPVGELRWKSPGSWEYGDDFSLLPSGITRKMKIVPMGGKPGEQAPFYGFDHEVLDGHSVLERAGEVRRQVIDALERLLSR